MKIELTCFLYSKRMEEDLGIKSDDIEALVSIDTLDIESIRQTVDDNEYEISTKKCCVYMKSGESWVIKKSYEEMKRIWQQ